MIGFTSCRIALVAFTLACAVGRAEESGPPPPRPRADRVQVAPDGRSFVLQPSGEPFVPLGFNYDHDAGGRLLEDYWEAEWDTVVADLKEMRGLGANVVRIHLQFGKFMDAPDEPNDAAFDRLVKLAAEAERLGLYLDVTGLASYRKADVPAWYDTLPEADRWAAQARFWEEAARRLADSPAVFCYDLMNEPVIPGKPLADGAWLHPTALGGFHFVQYIALDPAGRTRTNIAREWVRTMTAAIRKHDADRPITVGLLPLFAPPGDNAGFAPEPMAEELDFVSVHVYPERGKEQASLNLLERCAAAGKPVVVEETFPLKCGPDELRAFMEDARPHVAGWVGFYWGTPPEELRESDDIKAALTLGWLDVFAWLVESYRPPQPSPGGA